MDKDFSLVKTVNKKSTTKNDTKKVNNTIKYTLEDFNKFRQTMKIKIPQPIIDKIKFIYNKTVESKTDYLNSRQKQSETSAYKASASISRDKFNTSNGKPDYVKKSRKVQELSDEDWESMRNFKITQKDKKSGFGKSLDDIRGLLNKITDETYDEMKNGIFNIIDISIKNKETMTYLDFTKVIEFVFDIVGSNSFYSEMYASFLCDFISRDGELYEWTKDHISILLSPIYDIKINANDIRIGDADKDYDEFCEINKENDRRRNLVKFFCDLVMNPRWVKFSDDGETNEIYCLTYYYNLFLEYGENNETHEQCAEACELFCILYKKIVFYTEQNDNDKKSVFSILYNTVCKELINITKMKKSQLKTQYPGIINKTLFKLMDIKLNII